MAITEHHQLTDPAHCPCVIVKVGSALLAARDGTVHDEFLDRLVADIAARKAEGQAVVVVSSGAIALGAGRLGLTQGGHRTLAQAQAAAAVGQIALASAWSAAFERNNIVAAQVLLSLGDFEDRARYLNASATFATLLKAGAVPIVNENDSVATEEIRFGDNDRLAARVAQAAGAQAVVLLSDVDGLYDGDPAQDGTQRIERVDTISPEILASANGTSGSGLGTGGMRAKLAAAEIAGRAGTALVIASGQGAVPLSAALAAGGGTFFVPMADADARRSWIGTRQHTAGTLVVDSGCAAALHNGKSVLAAGIRDATGTFARGDLLAIEGPDGTPIAQGLAQYDDAQCRAIMGRRSAELAAILGHAPRSAVVHRDHLVML